MRSALLCGITQRRVVFSTDVSGQPVDPIVVDFFTLEEGTGKLYRNIGTELPLDVE
jgi:hypothetical protein